jgi:hypothetical protein
MLSGKPSVFFAADYALTLKHGLRTREQMLRERGSCDHLTWLTEYENLALRSREDAYFTYASLRARQTLKIAFYPRSPFGRERAMPKQHSEFRVLSCDIAAVDAKNNDFSAFSLLRVFPEPTLRVHVPYIERSRGYELRGQAVRIRQLMRDFQADYLVLDTRNVGQGVYQALARVLPDEERGVEYAPLCAMNDERMMRVPGADPIVFSVQGSAKLNSDIAVNMQYFLSESMLELLAPANEAGKPIISPKLLDDPDAVLFYESPYLNTMLAVAEMAGLTYERLASTGMVRVVERAGKTKDLYSSLSYGCWFAREMANDLAGGGEAEEIPFGDCCFGVLNF